ncbi:acireductone synthase [Bacteriovorax sp. BSW11_IV]|uniref:acireductone synthase n=1 Tax=Bacteriovorax sp. BSW11_IV TaxID=1353529 RepID=UPI00054F4DAA|nr:acireductone synthase [Bacteriovorax sp. BSW11_IV]
MKFVLMDVEGTTTSISFVHEVLFPFSRERMESFVTHNISQKEVRESLDLVKADAKKEGLGELGDKQAVLLLLKWIKEDRKHFALKTLQGLIWEEGYKSGEIKGHVYEDVLPCFKIWSEKGLALGIYSSGSVKAQHLIFEYSTSGNLRPYLKAHFDTLVGHKREVQSYLNIAKELGLNPNEILFLSDIKEELDAAKDAGMMTTQLVRDENVVRGSHAVIGQFGELSI